MKYLTVSISAEGKKQADKILNSLLKKKLVTGGMLINSPARFLWKGEIIDMNYMNITSYTIEKNKQSIIEDVRKNSIEEVPMITFTEFDGNEELLNWITEILL